MGRRNGRKAKGARRAGEAADDEAYDGESGGAIDGVMIDGRMVLEGGRLLTVDEEKLRADVEHAVERLNAANAESLAFGRSMENVVGAFCVAHSRSDFHIHRRAEACGT